MARITLATLKAQLDRIEAAVVPKKATGLSSKADQQTWETKGGRGAARPGLIVVITADAEVRHGEVVAAMDAVKQAGAANMVIPTRPREEKPDEAS